MTSSPVRPWGIAWGSLLTLLGIVGTWVMWRSFVATATGQVLDHNALLGSEIGRGRLWQFAEPLLDIVSIPFIVGVLGAAIVIAIIRRRSVLAIQVAMIVGGANVTTQVLKYLVLDRPTLVDDAAYSSNSLPSGHTTVMASVAFALILLVPPSLRALTALLAAGIAAGGGIATMIGGWHPPSDVVAAILVVLTWAGIATIVSAVLPPERGADELAAGVGSTISATALVVLGMASAVAAGAGLGRTEEALDEHGDELTDRADLAVAYGGGVIGVVAVVAISVALLLIAHGAASRPRSGSPRHARQSAQLEPPEG